jgi:hypothetical protein
MLQLGESARRGGDRLGRVREYASGLSGLSGRTRPEITNEKRKLVITPDYRN